MKNRLKEEVERIKKLFTEERLYGNIINEQGNPDTNNDGVIDGVEFTASGSDINPEEASAFLKSQDYFIKKGGGVEKNVQNICYEKPNMKKIYDRVKSYDGGSIVKNGKIMSNFSSNGGICFYYVKYLNLITALGTTAVERINFWDDGDGGFYLKLPYEINLNSVEKLMRTIEEPSTALLTVAGSNDLINHSTIIKYVKYKFKYDFDNDMYNDISVAGYYKQGFIKTKSLDTMLTDSINNPTGYNPLSDMSDPHGSRKWSTGLSTDQLVTDNNGAKMIGYGSLDDMLKVFK